MLKNELARAFKNRGMYFSLLFGHAISFYYIISMHIGKYNSQKTQSELGLELYRVMSQNTPFDAWLFVRIHKLYVLFMYFLPILATLPYAVSYAREKKLDYVKNVAVRCNRVRYRICKSVAVFLSGGFAVSSVMAVSLMLAFTFSGFRMPTSSGGASFVDPRTMLGVFYFSHPFLYCFVYIVAGFIFSGCMALISLLISEITVNLFTVSLTPFLIIMILNMVLIEEKGYYLPMQFLKASNGGYMLWMVPAIFVVVMVVTVAGFIYGGSKRDVL